MDISTTTTTFTAFIEEERARIKEAMKTAKAKRQEADDEISQLEAQVAAIAAYDAALKGKKPSAAPRASRGPKGEKRGAILSLIAEHPDGMTRAEVLTAMDAHGDKAAEQSISNALSALKRTKRVTQQGKKYHAREEEQPVSS